MCFARGSHCNSSFIQRDWCDSVLFNGSVQVFFVMRPYPQFSYPNRGSLLRIAIVCVAPLLSQSKVIFACKP